MSFLFGTSGGLQSITAGMEWRTSTNGTPAIETTIVRAGGTAIRFNNTGAAENIQHIFTTAQGVYYFCWYINLQAAPTTARSFLTILNSANQKVGIRITTGRALQLFNEEDSAQVGSDSSALTLGQWYRIELKIDSTTLASTAIEARAYTDAPNASAFWNPSGTIDITANPDRWRVGYTSSDATLDFVMTDAVICDNAGSYANTWPGPGWLWYGRPNGNGDNSQWTGSDGNSTDNYLLLDETPPNDATDYVESNTSGQIDDYTVDNTPAAVGPDDTIQLVAVGVRFAISNTTGGDPDFVLRIKPAASGTTDETGNVSGAGATTYNSMQITLGNYLEFANNSNYEQPGTSNPWTKAALDTAQIGIRESATDTHLARVSAMWLLARVVPVVTRFYLPSSGSADVSPTFDAGWEETGSADRIEMVLTKISSAMTDKSVTTIASTGDALCRQYVSNTLNAVTLTGNIRVYARANEALATVDATARIKVYVVNSAGDTVRGTLLAINDYSTGTEFNTSNRNKAFADGDTPSSVSLQQGDRIVLEIGFNHAAVISSAAVNFGDNSATDLLYDETTTAADNPFIEFNQTITEGAAPGGSIVPIIMAQHRLRKN